MPSLLAEIWSNVTGVDSLLHCTTRGTSIGGVHADRIVRASNREWNNCTWDRSAFELQKNRASSEARELWTLERNEFDLELHKEQKLGSEVMWRTEVTESIIQVFDQRSFFLSLFLSFPNGILLPFLALYCNSAVYVEVFFPSVLYVKYSS